MSAATTTTKTTTSSGFVTTEEITKFPNGWKMLKTSRWNYEDQPPEIEFSFEFCNEKGVPIFKFNMCVQQILTRDNINEIFATLNKLLSLDCEFFSTSFPRQGITYFINMIDSSLYGMVSMHFEKFLEKALIEQPCPQGHAKKSIIYKDANGNDQELTEEMYDEFIRLFAKKPEPEQQRVKASAKKPVIVSSSESDSDSDDDYPELETEEVLKATAVPVPTYEGAPKCPLAKFYTVSLPVQEPKDSIPRMEARPLYPLGASKPADGIAKRLAQIKDRITEGNVKVPTQAKMAAAKTKDWGDSESDEEVTCTHAKAITNENVKYYETFNGSQVPISEENWRKFCESKGLIGF
jgi:hypothetical protein